MTEFNPQVVIPAMLIVLVISFVWSWVATKEISAIAASDPARAALWASANATMNFVLTFIIAASLAFIFIFPYVLGNSLATYAVLRLK